MRDFPRVVCGAREQRRAYSRGYNLDGNLIVRVIFLSMIDNIYLSRHVRENRLDSIADNGDNYVNRRERYGNRNVLDFVLLRRSRGLDVI